MQNAYQNCTVNITHGNQSSYNANDYSNNQSTHNSATYGNITVNKKNIQNNILDNMDEYDDIIRNIPESVFAPKPIPDRPTSKMPPINITPLRSVSSHTTTSISGMNGRKITRPGIRNPYTPRTPSNPSNNSRPSIENPYAERIRPNPTNRIINYASHPAPPPAPNFNPTATPSPNNEFDYGITDGELLSLPDPTVPTTNQNSPRTARNANITSPPPIRRSSRIRNPYKRHKK